MWDLIVSVPDHCLSFYLTCLKTYLSWQNLILHNETFQEVLKTKMPVNWQS